MGSLAHTLTPFPVVAPLGAAAILAAIGPRLPRALLDGAAVLTSLGCLVMSLLLAAGTRHGAIIYWFGHWTPGAGHFPVGIDFLVDPLAATLSAYVAALVTLAFVFSSARFPRIRGLYHVMMLVFLAAMSGLCLSGDLFNLFVWFELMTATAVALAGYKIHETGPLQGALTLAVTNTVGAFLTLTGIAFLYAYTGSLNFAGISEALHSHPPPAPFLACAFVLVSTGFLVKAAAVPFHFWLPDAHAVAPVSVCMLFSGVMVQLGLYAIARILLGVFLPAMSAQEHGLRLLLSTIGAATAVVGALECFVQHHLKRLLAFSTIAHTGLMMIGLAMLTPASIAGMLGYLLAHGFLKAALFAGAGIVLHRSGSLDEWALHGRLRDVKPVGVLMLIAAAGLTAIPPYATFFTESFIDHGLEERKAKGLIVIFIFASAVTAAAIFRFVLRAFWGAGVRSVHSRETPSHEQREADWDPRTLPGTLWVPAALALGLSFTPAFFPGICGRATAVAARALSTHWYGAKVLGGAVSPVRAHRFLPAEACWPCLASAALALALAWATLSPRTSRLFRKVFRVWSPFHYLQSGRVTDYVAWLAAGVGAWTALLGFTLR